MKHIEIIEENNHNAINRLNKQVKINNHLNQSLSNLKLLIEHDRIEILYNVNETNKVLSYLKYKLLFLDQETKLKY